MRAHVKPAIQLCPRCGHMRVNHPGARIYECPVSDAMLDALRRFKAENGRRWKFLLSTEWQKGCSGISGIDERALLQQARNVIGSEARLGKIKLEQPTFAARACYQHAGRRGEG